MTLNFFNFFSICHNMSCQVPYLIFGACRGVISSMSVINNNIQDLLISSCLNDLTNC